MSNLQKLGIVVVVLVVSASLRFGLIHRTAALSPAVEPGATIPHMDHSPRHGGLVLMRGDTHFEIVLGKNGDSQVYFTDAGRSELPASFASEVDLGLVGSGGGQTVPLRPDQGGKMWVGKLSLAPDPEAIVRVTYVAVGEQPYWIDVPLSAWPN